MYSQNDKKKYHQKYILRNFFFFCFWLFDNIMFVFVGFVLLISIKTKQNKKKMISFKGHGM